ncbi:MAG TPA: glycoside hydrolase family 2 protein [Puia sp.]|nr:glycoside hydrolase family 2 protein [Puia sp.]
MKKTGILVLCLAMAFQLTAQKNKNGNTVLREGWQMQSSMSVSAGGAAITAAEFNTSGWYPVSLPTTVIAGLLKNKVYDFDPFYGDNLKKIAGPEFNKPWWFRKTFSLPGSDKGKIIRLILHGINYRANIWINGTLVADSNEVIGPYRIFEFDITKYIHHNGENVLALQIARPINPNRRGGDLAIDYADWIHYPADYNGGIVNDVEIGTAEPVAVRYPLVTTKFDLPSLQVAHLSVDAELVNYADQPARALVKGRINDSIGFQQEIVLAPHESRNIHFSPEQYKTLNIKNPRIWWPWQYGKPLLNDIRIEAVVSGKLSGMTSDRFGIREVTSEMIDTACRKFIINGKPILLRGAAWAPDIFQRRSSERQEQEIRLVRDMHMNIIRSEGKLEDDRFYELCDQYGLLVMTGWMCCGAWQYPELWDSTKRNVAMESAKSVMYWLRNKACIFVWLNGSDMPPRDTTVEKDYLQIEKELKWPNPILATATAEVSKVSGRSGVKMNGPYDWVPPIYWETDSGRHGGAWGFATEISPGPSIPPMESLLRFIPEDSLSVNDSLWHYHCGTMQFGKTDFFNSALEARYGPAPSIRNFVAKAQAQNYEAHRAMMEAYGLNKYNRATGVVQWMLSNPWPGLIWHTYDYYLYPAGTYFGIKKALEPLHVQYSYQSHEVIISNSLPAAADSLKVSAILYNSKGKPQFSRSGNYGVSGDAIQRCFEVPQQFDADSLGLLRLSLRDKHGKQISINWYWLSAADDSLEWKKSTWYYTPQKAYTNYQALQRLQLTPVKTSFITKKDGDSTIQRIRISNTGSAVAFFVHLRMLNRKNGTDILPVIFDDNYFSLAPGETRIIDCRYLNRDAANGSPYLLTSVWNLDKSGSTATGNAGFDNELKGD